MSINISKISKKIPHNDNRKTLLLIHEDKTDEFKRKEDNLKSLNNMLDKYKKMLSYSSDQNDIKNKIKKIENEINDITNNISESEYYLRSSNYLKEYYQNNNKRGLISKQYIQNCMGNNPLNNDNILQDVKITREMLRCKECNTNLEINHKEALAICSNCGYTIDYQDNDNCNEFSEEIEVLATFCYKRINHYREWITMLLARESSSPSQEIIDKLLIELKKDRITDPKDVTPKRIRGYLKKLGLNKQYEHCSSIIHKICGTSPPKISRELENKLIIMFEEMQDPYDKYKPPERKNFLSYSYVLYKLCEILDEKHLLDSFSLLKSRDKLYEQDQIFEKICKDRGWPFKPSI